MCKILLPLLLACVAVAQPQQTFTPYMSTFNRTINDAASGRAYLGVGSTTNLSLNAITADAASSTITNAAFTNAWNWQLTGAHQRGFRFGESAASTGGSGDDQFLLSAETLAGSTANPFQIVAGGTQLMYARAATSQILFGQGTAAAPMIGFALNAGYGFNLNAGGYIEMSLAGTERFRLDGNGVKTTGNGSAAQPAYSTTGASGKSGIYFPSATQVAIAANNVAALGVNSDQITTSVAYSSTAFPNSKAAYSFTDWPYGGLNLSLLAPTYYVSLQGTNDTLVRVGVSSAGATNGNDISFFVNGTQQMQVKQSTISMNGLAYTWPASQSANTFLKTDGSGNLTWSSSSTGLIIPLSGVSADTASASINNTTFTNNFRYTNATASSSSFTIQGGLSALGAKLVEFTEDAASTAGTSTNQSLVHISTLSGSTASPLIVDQGGTNVFRVGNNSAQIIANSILPNLPVYTTAHNTNNGLYSESSTSWSLNAGGGTRAFTADSTGFNIKVGSGSVVLNGGVTADNGISMNRRVNTTTSGTVTLTTSITGGASRPFGIFNNSGASGTVTYNLPTAVIGAEYTFTVMAAQFVVIQVDTGSTIQGVGSVTTSGGTLTSDGTLGNTVTIVCVAANKWVIIAINGTWVAA